LSALYPSNMVPPCPVLSRLDCQTVLQPFGQVYHSPNKIAARRWLNAASPAFIMRSMPPQGTKLSADPSGQHALRTLGPAQVALRPGSVGSRQENRRNLTLPMRPFCAQRVGIKPRCPEGQIHDHGSPTTPTGLEGPALTQCWPISGWRRRAVAPKAADISHMDRTGSRVSAKPMCNPDDICVPEGRGFWVDGGSKRACVPCLCLCGQ